MVCPLIWQFVENVRFLVIMCIELYQEVEYFTDKNGEITHDVIHKKKKNNQIWTTQKMYITSVIHIHCMMWALNEQFAGNIRVLVNKVYQSLPR